MRPSAITRRVLGLALFTVAIMWLCDARGGWASHPHVLGVLLAVLGLLLVLES
jgi:hypothetical protein